MSGTAGGEVHWGAEYSGKRDSQDFALDLAGGETFSEIFAGPVDNVRK